MKPTRRLLVSILACFAIAGMAGFMVSSWYLWHFASRVPNPARRWVYPKALGAAEEFGERFTVYLSSTERVLLWQELYIAICFTALILMVPLLSWKFPISFKASPGR